MPQILSQRSHHLFEQDEGGVNASITALWVIDVQNLARQALPDPILSCVADDKSQVKWVSVENVLSATNLSTTGDRRLRRELRKEKPTPEVPDMPRVATVGKGEDSVRLEGPVELPPTRRPWLLDYEDLPPPPPTPRHIRRIHGRWKIWQPVLRGTGASQWVPLPEDLSHALDAVGTLPAAKMPGELLLEEEEEDELQRDPHRDLDATPEGGIAAANYTPTTPLVSALVLLKEARDRFRAAERPPARRRSKCARCSQKALRAPHSGRIRSGPL